MAKGRSKKPKAKSTFKRRKGAWDDENAPWGDGVKKLEKSLNRGGGRR